MPVVRAGEEASLPPPPATQGVSLPFGSVSAAAMQATDEVRLNSTGRTMTIVVPVKDGPNYIGDVEAQITSDDAILI